MYFAISKHKLACFCRLDSADRWLLLHAAVWLAIARIMLAVLPFRRLSVCLSAGGDSAQLASDPEVLRRIGRAVSIAANNVPWRADCFPQAIAARMLLRRRRYGSVMHLGAARIGDNERAAHAWLTCGGTIVTGGAQRGRYTELHALNSPHP